MTSKKESLSWSQKISKARILRSKGAALNFERIAILAEVYRDEEFLAEHGELEALSLLDEEVADLCADFKTLLSVYERFPRKTDWENKPLQKLVAQVLDEQAQARRQASGEKPPRHRASVSVKQHEETVKEKEIAETRAKSLAEELIDARRRIKELESENQELRQDVARANGRIAELERIAKRSAVAMV